MHFLFLELVEGKTLSERLRRGRLRVDVSTLNAEPLVPGVVMGVVEDALRMSREAALT